MSVKRQTSKTSTPPTITVGQNQLDEADSNMADQVADKMKARFNDEGLSITELDVETILAVMRAIGTLDIDFYQGFASQLVNVGTIGPKADPNGSNFVLSVVKGIEPQDQMEAMLAAQMAAIHNATMTMARRFNHVETVDAQNSAERTLNKLARTYVKQMECLKKYRTGGEQKVTVEHVTVNKGGQAIVGNLSAGGHGKKDKATP